MTLPWARRRGRWSSIPYPEQRMAEPYMSYFCLHSLSRRLEIKRSKWHACEESATCLETLVAGNISGIRKALPAFTTSRREQPSRRSHCKVNFPFPELLLQSGGRFQFPFVKDWTSRLGILATYALTTKEQNPGPSSNLKSLQCQRMMGWYFRIL